MSDAKTIYLKDYKPPVFAIERVELDFDLYEDHALVTNHMHLKRKTPGPLHLNGDDLELMEIHLNHHPFQAYKQEKGDLIIAECPDDFELTIVTRIKPQENTQLTGLYKTVFFCTQCESQGFRRITFFLDRPDVLTKFVTKITADEKKYPVLLSNGNLIDSGKKEQGRHWVVWEDPFKKPSYLFALVAGDLVCIQDSFTTSSNKKVDLRIYVEAINKEKCQHAMESVKKAMRWDEQKYGREYDLSIFMIVATSDFNMGAMENKGLNIFNSKYILACPKSATDKDFIDIEGVVGHEYFHNWTGNRITCRDWFQLSLKEGLTVFRDQEFTRDMQGRDICRIGDVKVLKAAQFPEDAGSMAHPVRPESYQEINNFYTATVYNKGAEVIRMQQSLLGNAGFRKGMDLYFQRYDGQAVTIEDFVKSMEDANKVDFTQFKRWYSQAGTPRVKVETQFKENTLSLTLTQTCKPTADKSPKEPFHIPIAFALFDAQGKQLPTNQRVLELREKVQTFTFENLAAKPLVSLLRDFSAPIILEQSLNQEEKLALFHFETNGYAKWNAGQSLAKETILEFMQQKHPERKINLKLIQAYEKALKDETLDKALIAEILNPPGFEEVIASLSLVDVAKVEEARDAFHAELGQALWSSLLKTYQTLEKQEKGEINALAFGARALKNTCLWFLMKADETKASALCKQQFESALTMTDTMASFALLSNSQGLQQRLDAVNAFYQQWQNNELVLDKWFSVQALCEQVGTLETVKSLLKHKAFSFKNPNKVRALIGAFCAANPRHFHALDGSGYSFLSDMLLELDKINPQIAARLAQPFTHVQRFDKPRQSLMQMQLARLAKAKLSKDLQEVVLKSLV